MDDDPDREAMLQSIDALTVAITLRSVPLVLEHLLSTNLSVPQLRALTITVTAPEPDGITANRLAEALGVSLPAVSKLVDRLHRQELIFRTQDPTDLRVRRIHATDLGRAVVRELMTARPELGGDVLTRLPTDDLRALEQGLRAVNNELRDLRA